MQRKRFKIFKVSVAIFGAFGVILVGYIALILIQMPLTMSEKKDLTQIDNEKGDQSNLEEGAFVERAVLDRYFLMSDSSQLPDQDLKVSGRYYSVLSDIQLPSRIENSCARLYCFQHRIKFDNIPSIFWKGLIGIEDYRFLNHIGIDFFAIARAIITDIRKMRFEQGGSTLTQQLVKNLFLTNEKTISRKMKEIVYSIYIELRYEKEQILEAYFNEVYWGAVEGLRIKGIYAASILYFGKKPHEITPYESTILISMLKGPGYYSPLRNIKRLKSRVDVVYNKLVELSIFSSEIEYVWSQSDWERWEKSIKARNEKKLGLSYWKSEKDDDTQFEFLDRFTFIESSDRVLREIKKWRKIDEDIAVKVVIGRPRDGGKQLFRYYSKFERDWGRAFANERHQVGSTLKPLIYSLFFEAGRKTSDFVSTSEIVLELKSGRWSPREAHKVEQSEITLIEALQQSLNRPVIRLAQEIGFDLIEEKLDRFMPRLEKPLSEYPAQLLGAIELSVEELYEVYLRFVTKECGQGNKDLLLELLADPTATTVKSVVSKEMSGMRFFGKTGTSNRGLDNWYLFFDGDLLGVIWVGLDGNRKDKNLRLYGSSTAFQIFQRFAIGRGKRFSELSCVGF